MTKIVKISIKHIVGFNKDCTPKYEIREQEYTVHACCEEEMNDKIYHLKLSYGDNQVFSKRRITDGKVGHPTLFILD